MDVYTLADKVTAGLEGIEVPLRVAVMGCVVNGPGEAREADLGVASGNGKGQIFVRGEVIKTVPESQIVETLIEEALRMADELGTSGAGSESQSRGLLIHLTRRGGHRALHCRGRALCPAIVRCGRARMRCTLRRQSRRRTASGGSFEDVTFVRPAPSRALRIEVLAAAQRCEVERLAAADPLVNAVVAARLASCRTLEPARLGGVLLGSRRDGELSGAAFNGGNLLPIGGEHDDWTALAEQIAQVRAGLHVDRRRGRRGRHDVGGARTASGAGRARSASASRCWRCTAATR